MAQYATPQRYPSSLSRGQGGPSRRPSRTQLKYPTPSIDDEMPSPPQFSPTYGIEHGHGRPLNPQSKPYLPKSQRSTPNLHYAAHNSHVYPDGTLMYPSISPHAPYGAPAPVSDRPEYSSLQHLLEQAGYAETRIHTPPAERVQQYRRIKKTFDEVDPDEVRDLYSTYGLAAGPPPLGYSGYDYQPSPLSAQFEHRVTHVTEPGLPLKSSSSLLRNLALQDTAHQQYVSIPHSHPTQLGPGDGYSYDHWWNGGIAALGRAAKAVMEMSPPSKSSERFDDIGRNAPTGLGLGLARGGEGVRKAKSNWELGAPRVSDFDQEQVAPRLSSFADGPPPFAPPPTLRERRGAVTADLPPIDVSSPPKHVDAEEYGYSPLPADYEAQCDDDELFGTSFVGSVDSDPARSPTPSETSLPACGYVADVLSDTDEDAVDALMRDVDDSPTKSERESVRSLGFGLGMGELSLGDRVMRGAIDIDEYEFDSPTKGHSPLPDVETPTKPSNWTFAPRPDIPRAITAPAPPPVAEPAVNELPTPTAPKVLKYGDRATKLRMARSTPALRAPPEATWLSTIRSYVLPEPVYTSIPDPTPSTSAPAPIKLTPALPAAPTVARAEAVVCDSTSDMAEDLPAIPSSMGEPASSSYSMRLKPSLARMRSMFLGQPDKSSSSDTTPTLSPRMDLAQGEFFAGWSPVKGAQGRGRSGTVTGAKWSKGSPETPKQAVQDGYGTTEIDYTKSFFYKPCTPPAPTAVNAAPPTDRVARRQGSVKSLRKALLIPVAPPPVPALPAAYSRQSPSGTTFSSFGSFASFGSKSTGTSKSSTAPLLATPPFPAQRGGMARTEPPVLAIHSPGAWEEGRPARELVLEGEEWDARDGEMPLWTNGKRVKGKASKGKGKLRRKRSEKSVGQA